MCLILVLLLYACGEKSDTAAVLSVHEVMDSVITRLYAQVPVEQYNSIDEAFILHFLTFEEKKVLSTRYQYFRVNVPVMVSLMRHKDQQTVPFWLEDAGFTRSGKIVENEEYEYEVWQKQFEPGWVELGINGFDKHRPVYFVSVGPVNAADELKITNAFPEQFPTVPMTVGAFTYHDWPGLELTAVPPELVGQSLFTTVRGRAREAHVVGAFRETLFPSSAVPDQVMQTWSGDPKTSVDIQWRTHPGVKESAVKYWVTGTTDTLETKAVSNTLQDRMLSNDRYIQRHTVSLRVLKPGTRYGYTVGSGRGNNWSPAATFETEADEDKGFSFIWFGDTHCFPDSGRMITLADQQHKDIAFYSIAGDIVSTGLYRDEWDQLFQYSGGAFSRKPLMPVPGNHDRQDGLGAQLYYDLFSLPHNGPPRVEPEASYAFEYGDALFLMIDATSEVTDHTAWIEEKLTSSKASWKFAMFHFPPYNFEEPYQDIQQAWVPLFDKYHVDMVMGGHIHYYMRSNPMAGGKVVDSFDQGTVYTISISIPSEHNDIGTEPYAAARYKDGYFYQRVDIAGDVLSYRTFDDKGTLKDSFTIRKKQKR
ncbi:metallophosphoesterase [Parachryseolinea silvisoli]|uniref:metallophosphoesterase n=1 Tax=Parachryseolinea silvisoli TaxID=2873601 RepID=UPI0037C7A054|nr:metallophosphoesterase family protein [Parachryseolinea silvisoli]